MSTPPRMTVDEFIVRYAGVAGAELVDGVVRLPSDPPPVRPDGPCLVVLRCSLTDRWLDRFQQMAAHLQAGARVVLILDEKSSTVSVYRDDESPCVLRGDDTLTLPDVLPGFSVPVNRLFA